MSDKTDNELIAEIMGFEILSTRRTAYGTDEHTYKIIDDKGRPVHPYYGGFRGPHMQFDRSWDWLMPVVEKIYQIAPESVREINNEGLTIFELGLIAPITEVHAACIEFIKWYNETKPV